MTFVKAIRTCFRKYSDFKGRACRAEYWYFALFVVLVELLLSAVVGLVALPALLKGAAPADLMRSLSWAYIVHTVVALALLLPSLAVTTRRLHDTNRSGWWLFACYALAVVGSVLIGIAMGCMEAGMELEGMLKGLMVAGIALLIPVFPFAVVLLIWMIQKGTTGPNRYGDDPKRIPGDDEVVDVEMDENTRKAAKADDYMPSSSGKRTLTLLFGALMLASFSSCERIDSDTLIGRWELTHAEVYGINMPVAEGDIYTFRLDGTYTIRSDGKVTAEGTWEYSENLLSLYSNSNEYIGATYDVTKLTSTEMTLEFDFGFVYGAMDLVKSSRSAHRSPGLIHPNDTTQC